MVAESETVKRRIRDLRVVDLRNELESRGLDKNGVKATLVDRLTKALLDEGLDPEEYYFDTCEKKSMKRNSVGKNEHDGISDMESFADGGDVSNANEFDDETKEELVKDNVKEASVGDSEFSGHTDYQSQLKMDAANSQENNDAVEDCINLNLEDEENFDEEENSAKEKDEQPPRRGLTRMEPQQHENSSSTGGDLLLGQTSSSSNDGGNGDLSINNSTSTTKTGSGLSSNTTATDGNGEKGTRDDTGPEGQHSSGTQDVTGAQSSSTTSSGEKAKSGSSGAKDATTKIATKDDRDKKKGVGGNSTGGGSSSRNLWVSGLSTSTRATDLKHLFSKYGKVIGAKVVTNARTPGARCYGYVTMATSEDASKCIQHLHRTELHGRMISVEKAKGESGPRKPDLKPDSKGAGGIDAGAEKNGVTDKDSDSTSTKKKDLMLATTEGESPSSAVENSTGETSVVAPVNTSNDKESKEDNSGEVEDASQQQQPVRENAANKGRFANRGDRRMDRSGRRPPSPHRQRHAVLTFQHIREERERQRLREREREERQAERRRREEIARQREHERKQREEALRLKEERERLRIERERLEREKAELMRLERERQRLEREKIEAEREELKRQQARSLARIEEVRRAAATKRNAPGERDDYFVDRKRIAVDGSMRYDAPPPSNRYEGPKSSSGTAGHFGTPASSGGSDYRGSKASMDLGRSGTYDHQSRNRFERPPPTSSVSASGSVISRRVVQQEISSSIRRDGRSPPSPPPPSARERLDDRRVLDRGRDDRFGRGSRGQDSFSDRDRERERERQRERGIGSGGADRVDAVRGRMHGRGGGAGNGGDHRDRYNSDGRSTKDNGGGGDHRYERSSETWRTTGGSGGAGASSGVGNSKSSYGNGSSSSTGMMANGTSASSSNWQAQSSVSSDRWGSSAASLMPPISRSLASSGAFNNNWSTSAPPPVFSGAIGSLNSTVIGQSSSISYSTDRYSRH